MKSHEYKIMNLTFSFPGLAVNPLRTCQEQWRLCTHVNLGGSQCLLGFRMSLWIKTGQEAGTCPAVLLPSLMHLEHHLKITKSSMSLLDPFFFLLKLFKYISCSASSKKTWHFSNGIWHLWDIFKCGITSKNLLGMESLIWMVSPGYCLLLEPCLHKGAGCGHV